MRYEDWATRLDAYIAAAWSMPFSYDRSMGLDCCTFTFGAIHAMTGVNIGQRFAGTYSTKRESLVRMREYCGKAELTFFLAKLMNEFGFQRVPPFSAQRGDALVCPQVHRGGYFFGILDLNGRDILSVGELRARRVPVGLQCRAWRIA